MENPTQKFFLYARKSTDVEDKQVRSIEDQIAELRTFAKQENLNIVEIFTERQSAKVPGRPIFNAMLGRIEQGEANGILAWHADRLARNSVDGGRIIYLLDCGHIQSLKFPTLWFENTPQGKFMLNIVFGQSKYYIDSLSENVKRGLRQKVRRGEWPSTAPTGYINDVRTKSIIVDKKKSKVIKKAFELYAKNESRLEDISDFLAENGIMSKGGKRISRDRISFILSNPFYYGHFRWKGETYEGIHEPIISKKIFDKAQEVLNERSKPKTKPKVAKPFTNLFRCGECGMMFTAETQKGHIYYRCTKKHKTKKCSQPYIREEELDRQLSAMIQKFSLPKDWADFMFEKLEVEEKQSTQSFTAFVQEKREEIRAIDRKLQRLLDSYLDQIIEREIYLENKAKLMSEKKSLEEQIVRFKQKQNNWLEPFRKWINTALQADKIARDENLFDKRVLAEEIFGSNLRLADREARASAPSETKHAEKSGQNPWAALAAANEKAGKIPTRRLKVGPDGIEPSTS